MNMLITFYVSLCLFLGMLIPQSNAGGMFFEGNARDKTNPRKCYSSIYGQQLKMRKVYRTPVCGTMRCDRNFVITYYTCGAIEVPNGCYQNPGSPELRFPQCCPSITCDESAFEGDEDNEISFML